LKALESRIIIEQAKGIAAQHTISVDQAYQLMRAGTPE
jgi:AmiR/NasT family two-component response regulator